MADLEEVPEEVRDELEFHGVQKMEDVLKLALTAPEKLNLSDGSDKTASKAQPAPPA